MRTRNLPQRLISPTEVAETKPIPPKPRKIRKGAFYTELFTDVLGLPHELWCPATSVSRPVARSIVNNKKKKFADTDHSPLWSEIRGFRLLQVYVDYRAPDGTIKR